MDLPNNFSLDQSFLDDSTHYLGSDNPFSNEATNVPHYIHPDEETPERPALPHDGTSVNPSNSSTNPFKGGHPAAAPPLSNHKGRSVRGSSHSPQRPGHINLPRLHMRITNAEKKLDTTQQELTQFKQELRSSRQQLAQFDRRTLQLMQVASQLQAYMEEVKTLKQDVQTCLVMLNDMTDEA